MGKQERMVVTGSEGILGTVLYPVLAKEYDVVRIDSKQAQGVVSVDLADKVALEKALDEAQPFVYVVHLAASADHCSPVSEVVKNNVIVTSSLYEYLAHHAEKLKKIIFTSSTHAHAYPGYYPRTSPFGRPIRPDDPPSADSPYGASKVFGEELARYYYQEFHIPTIVLRIGGLAKHNQPVPPYDRLWLSHRDAASLFLLALQSDIPFGIYYAMSGNADCPYDIESTKNDLGYFPQDGLQKNTSE